MGTPSSQPPVGVGSSPTKPDTFTSGEAREGLCHLQKHLLSSWQTLSFLWITFANTFSCPSVFQDVGLGQKHHLS